MMDRITNVTAVTQHPGRRRALGSILAGACVLISPRPALPQAKPKLWRIGALHFGSSKLPGGGTQFRGFLEGLSELGYAEGRNLVVFREFAENDARRLPELAASLLKQDVDLIVTSGTQAVRAATQATRTLPIVTMNITDPVGSGFAASLVRPGGNVTGMTNIGEELSRKRLEILCEMVPHATRIARLHNPDNPVHMRLRSGTEAHAKQLGREAVSIEVRAQDDLDAAFARIAREGAGALTVGEDSVIVGLAPRIAALAMQYKLPAMWWAIGTRGDRLAGYGPNFFSQGQRAASIAVKILEGAKAADVPFQQPTEFDFVIDMKVAKALAVTVPQSVLVRATRVIE